MENKHKFMIPGVAIGCVVGAYLGVIYGPYIVQNSPSLSLTDIALEMVYYSGIGCVTGGFTLGVAGLILEDFLAEFLHTFNLDS